MEENLKQKEKKYFLLCCKVSVLETMKRVKKLSHFVV